MNLKFDDALRALGYTIEGDAKVALSDKYYYDPIIGCITSIDNGMALDAYEANRFILSLAGIQTQRTLASEFVTPSELKDVPEPYLIDDILPQGQAGLIVAPPKSMKSYFMLYMAVCVATGRDFAGHKVKKSNVMIFQNENTQGIEYKRFKQMGGEKIPNISINFSKNMKIEDIEQYEDIIRARDVKLVIIDPFYLSIRGGNGALKDEERITNILEILGDFKRKLGDVTFIIVHHTKKIDPKRKQSKDFEIVTDDIFGSTFIDGWREFVFLITPHNGWSSISMDARSYFTEEKLACRMNNFGFEVMSYKKEEKNA